MVAMKRQTIIEALKSHRPRLEARGVAHIALFVSSMRGDEHAGSDLDVLLDIAPGHEPVSLVQFAGVCRLIEEITGLEATAVERRMLTRRPEFARRIADDLVEVF
jgi:uncharacterized protein